MRSGGYPDLEENKLCCHSQDAVLVLEKCQLYRRIDFDSLESYLTGIVELLSLSTFLKLALISWNLSAGELHAFLQFPHDEKVWENLHGQYQYYSHEQVSYGDFIRSFDFLLSFNLPVPGQASRSEPAITQNNQMPISRTYFNRNFGPGISLRRMQVMSSTTDSVLSFSGRLHTSRTPPSYYWHYGLSYPRHVRRHSIFYTREKHGPQRTSCVRQQVTLWYFMGIHNWPRFHVPATELLVGITSDKIQKAPGAVVWFHVWWVQKPWVLSSQIDLLNT